MNRKQTITKSADRKGIHFPHVTLNEDPVISMTWWHVAPRWLILKIVTKKGLVGWGEGTLEGRSEIVANQITSLADFVIGADSNNIDFIVELIRKAPFYSYGCPVMGSALAAIDTALWDIKGKRSGEPLCDLLGGRKHDRIQMYHWFGGNVPHVGKSTKMRPNVQDMLGKLLSGKDPKQSRFFKMNAIPEVGAFDANGAVEHAAGVLEVLYAKYKNSGVRFGIDCHGRLELGPARKFLKAIEPYREILLFVEELVPVRLAKHFPRLVDSTSIPLSTGERFYEFEPFQGLVDANIALFQPDVAHCQGITMCRKIGHLAEENGLGSSFHCPNGPVSLMASLHLKMGLSDSAPQECSDGIHYSGATEIGFYLVDPSLLRADADGFMTVPNAPGLGIELDEEKLRLGARRKLWDESTCYLYSRTGCPRAW